MTEITRDHVQSALSVLQALAPNGKAQQECSDLLHRAQAEGASEKEQLITMIGATYDGLRHGNWPWIARRRPYRAG